MEENGVQTYSFPSPGATLLTSLHMECRFPPPQKKSHQLPLFRKNERSLTNRFHQSVCTLIHGWQTKQQQTLMFLPRLDVFIHCQLYKPNDAYVLSRKHSPVVARANGTPVCSNSWIWTVLLSNAVSYSFLANHFCTVTTTVAVEK